MEDDTFALCDQVEVPRESICKYWIATPTPNLRMKKSSATLARRWNMTSVFKNISRLALAIMDRYARDNDMGLTKT